MKCVCPVKTPVVSHDLCPKCNSPVCEGMACASCECPKDHHGRHCWRTMGAYGVVHNDCQECHGCGVTREVFEAIH